MWLECLRADFQRYAKQRQFSLRSILWKATHTPGLLASLVLRTQESAYRHNWLRTSHLMRSAGLALVAADFVPGCSAGPGLLMHHPSGIVIGKGARIGSNVTLLQHVTLGERYTDGRPPNGYPRLEDDVTVGASASLLGQISIGRGAVIGAHALVLTDVPPGTTAVGAPARTFRSTTAQTARRDA